MKQDLSCLDQTQGNLGASYEKREVTEYVGAKIEEAKEEIKITRNSPLQKTPSQYLFQGQTFSPRLRAFGILKKELKSYELGFRFIPGMGFYHVENSFYLGGGST